MAKVIMADEVKRHNTRKSVWIVYRNDVYDVTNFIDQHPGGEEPILEAAGQDATIAFDDVGHSPSAISMMKQYKIGTLAPGQGCQRSSKKSINKAPSSPKADRRIQKIVVPRESPRRCGPPCPPQGRRTRARQPPPPPAESSSKLKWALLALGLAIIVGVAFKKYSSG